eukprot:TRINITY_DN1523_c1_g1_i1.p1 TRINITY_DN1523_c1_g1~~TRINITY_DN1523_c1_g1_i1.p1  ORF type:complete len:355 (-),score=26.07 TRINITY_DN1523_c1_g1_i1:813-1736(-)
MQENNSLGTPQEEVGDSRVADNYIPSPLSITTRRAGTLSTETPSSQLTSSVCFSNPLFDCTVQQTPMEQLVRQQQEGFTFQVGQEKSIDSLPTPVFQSREENTNSIQQQQSPQTSHNSYGVEEQKSVQQILQFDEKSQQVLQPRFNETPEDKVIQSDQTNGQKQHTYEEYNQLIQKMLDEENLYQNQNDKNDGVPVSVKQKQKLSLDKTLSDGTSPAPYYQVAIKDTAQLNFDGQGQQCSQQLQQRLLQSAPIQKNEGNFVWERIPLSPRQQEKHGVEFVWTQVRKSPRLMNRNIGNQPGSEKLFYD